MPEAPPSKMAAEAMGWKLFQGQKPSSTLMIQNCDLPPPVNVFTGLSDDTNRTSSKFSLMMMGQEQFNCERDKEDDSEAEKVHGKPRLGLLDDNKLELLKALRLSQTRARQAEKRSKDLSKENNSLSNAIIHQSVELIAYRNLVTLLELQISLFKSKMKDHVLCPCSCSCLDHVGSNISKRKTSSEEPETMSWVFALAIPFGVAGLGITLACRYLL